MNIPNLRGETETTFIARRVGQTITIQHQGRIGKRWQVLLVNIHAVEGVSEWIVEETTQGILITPFEAQVRVEIEL